MALSQYQEKFALLNQKMRWEIAAELRTANLEKANAVLPLVVPRDSFYLRYGKRVLDVLISSCILIVSLPINSVLVLITLFDLGRPILFFQQRLGRYGNEFTLVKLRTMRIENDADGRPLLGALRVTRIGRLIRRLSLDELLNFWSIFKGDMSLIGPRPLVPEYLERFSDRHRQRLVMKPGLECPLPIPSEAPVTYQEQLENDCWYVCNASFRTDLRLAWRVIASALDRRQNASRAASERGSFMGYDENGRVVTSKDIPIWAMDLVLRRNGLLPEDSDPRFS